MINMKVSLSPHLNIAGIVHPDLMGKVLHHLGCPRTGAAHHVLEPEYLFLELIQFTTLFFQWDIVVRAFEWNEPAKLAWWKLIKPDSSWFWLFGDEDDISQTGHLTNAQWKVFFLWFSIMFCKIALDGGDSWLMTTFRCHYLMVTVLMNLMKGLKPLCCSMTHSYWTLTRA